MADSYDDLQQSYGRCLRGKNFIERFYEIFLASQIGRASCRERV